MFSISQKRVQPDHARTDSPQRSTRFLDLFSAPRTRIRAVHGATSQYRGFLSGLFGTKEVDFAHTMILKLIHEDRLRSKMDFEAGRALPSSEEVKTRIGYADYLEYIRLASWQVSRDMNDFDCTINLKLREHQ
jgi:hypothetical protein